MKPKTIVHLLSGGLDSVTLMYELKAQGHLIHALLVDYGQPHVRELDFASMHASRCGILSTRMKVPSLGGLTSGNWIVPNRNQILVSLAVNVAERAGAEAVTIGCNLDDSESFPDCRPAFVDAMNKAIFAAGYQVELCAPYLFKRKWEIGALAREIGIRSAEIWTCYSGGESPCGICPACEKLKLSGI